MIAAPTAVEIFCSYAHEDEAWRQQLETHLSLLKRQGLISLWHDRLITPGINWAKTVDTHLETASIILLLVSADFLASDYCYSIEMKRALERHTANEARVIPILVRPVDWKGAPFAHLQALPTDAKPIASWRSKERALVNVAAGIRRVIEEVPLLAASAPRAALPTVWNIPYPRNPFFLGRDGLVVQIRRHLQTGQTTALSQPQAISGLGGVGKTQIAVEYAYQFHQEYEAVLWAGAESQEALFTSYTELATLLNLPERETQEQDRVITAVKTWLQRHRKWLLILDNADDLDVVPAFLPPSPGGHVLLTTRAWDMQRLAQRVEVESLPTEVGALFLLRRASRLPMDAPLAQATPQDRALACQVAEQMGGLPLALDQAGAYLEATGMRLQAYQQVYQQHRQMLHQRRGARVPDHPEPVATTLALSFACVEQRDRAAAELLRLCAFLAPDAIPEEMLIQGAAHLGSVLAPVVADPFRLGQAIEALRTYSLIRRDPHNQTLALHRLVQAVVADEMDTATCQRWRERVIRLVREVLPEVEFVHWSAWERLLRQVLAATTWINPQELSVPGSTELLRRTGRYLTERARYQEAEPLLTRAREYSFREHGKEQRETASALYTLACLYLEQGKYAEAEPLYMQTLEIREQSEGPEHSSTATTLHELARLYQSQGKYAEAEPLLLRALRIKEHTLGPEHPSTAATLHTLACVYQDQGKYAEVESLLLRALRIREHTLGPEHPPTAATLNQLGRLYQNQGKYAEAEPLLLRALRIREHTLGPEHPSTAKTLHELARLYQNQGKYAEAEPLLLHALRIREHTLGPEHPRTEITRKSYASLLRTVGRTEEAELLETNHTLLS